MKKRPHALLLPLAAVAALSGCIGRDAPASKPAPLPQQTLAYRDLEGSWSCGRAMSSEFRDGSVTLTTITSEKSHAQAVVRASYELNGSELRMTVQSVRYEAGGAARAGAAEVAHPDLVTVDRITNFNGSTYHFERVALYQEGRMQPGHSSIGTEGDCTKSG
jgi:hypothetical protein